jgi:glyceraldehyde 3-phosphate dehydrogenase
MNRNVAINGAGEIAKNMVRLNAERIRSDEAHLNITHIVDGFHDRDSFLKELLSDPVRGDFGENIQKVGSTGINIGGNIIEVVSVADGNEMPDWEKLGVSDVMEATGQRVKEDAALEHITEGRAKKVMVTAPTKGDGKIAQTLIMGYNEADYDPEKHDVLTNESCTTKSALHVSDALNEAYELQTLSLSTVHAETGGEKRSLIERMGLVTDLSELGVHPQSTGSQGALSKLYPRVDVSAESYRVPTTDGSISDITFSTLKRIESIEELMEILERAKVEGVWEMVDTLENSADLIGNTHDSVVPRDKVKLIGKNQNIVRVVSGYDNANAPVRSAIDGMIYVQNQEKS